MAECRYFPECQRCNEVGDSWLPCAGGADGIRCKGYEPMPDVGALLALADEFDAEYAERSREMGLRELSEKGTTVSRRIREACGEVDA